MGGVSHLIQNANEHRIVYAKTNLICECAKASGVWGVVLTKSVLNVHKTKVCQCLFAWRGARCAAYILTLSSTLMLASDFLIRNAVSRAAGFAYQHSVITLASVDEASYVNQCFGMLGRWLSLQITCAILRERNALFKYPIAQPKCLTFHIPCAFPRL